MSRRPAGRATIATPRARRSGHRWGRTRGRIGFHGGKIEVERPRVRGVDGREVTIPSWETAAQEDWLVLRQVRSSPKMAITFLTIFPARSTRCIAWRTFPMREMSGALDS